ncbi:MAG: hypothetical protein HIU91_15485 [Acidobacteria bacterium]|nr:hypothetical protein [Acidobacteriota bacterium]
MRWLLKSSVPFAMVLPVLAMVVWVMVVGGAAVAMYRTLVGVTQPGQNATVHLGAFHETILPESFAPFAVNYAVLTHSHVLTAVYMPGAFLQMPVSLATTTPEAWYPRQLDEWTRRGVMLPLLSLPAWWLVGLAMEALLGRRRVRWPVVVLGCVLCVLFGTVLAGFLAGASESAGGGWVYAGLVLWIVLFGLLPLAGVRQWHMSRARSSG